MHSKGLDKNGYKINSFVNQTTQPITDAADKLRDIMAENNSELAKTDSNSDKVSD